MCNAAERLPDVSHVVFVVHGVSSSISFTVINIIIITKIIIKSIMVMTRWAGWWTRVRLGETPRPCGRTYHISLPRSSPSTKKGTFGGFRNCLMFHHNINRDICMWIVLESVWEKQRHNGLWNYTQKHSTVIWNGFEHGGWTREHLAVLRRPSKMEVYHRDIGNIIAHMYMATWNDLNKGIEENNKTYYWVDQSYWEDRQEYIYNMFCCSLQSLCSNHSMWPCTCGQYKNCQNCQN